MGLAGMYIMIDAVEQSLPLPRGEYDVPLIVSDMMFNADGSLLFNLNEDNGFYGDVITVNGRPWPLMKVQAPQVPLPHPQRLGLAVVPVVAVRRSSR